MQQPSTRTPSFRRTSAIDTSPLSRGTFPSRTHDTSRPYSARHNCPTAPEAGHSQHRVLRDRVVWRSSRRPAQTMSQISRAGAVLQATNFHPQPNKAVDSPSGDLPWRAPQLFGFTYRIIIACGHDQAAMRAKRLDFLCQTNDALMTPQDASQGALQRSNSLVRRNRSQLGPLSEPIPAVKHRESAVPVTNRRHRTRITAGQADTSDQRL